MVRDLKPKFVKHFAELGDIVVSATKSYVEEVRSGTFPDTSHSFTEDVRKNPDNSVNQPSNPAISPAYGPTS